LILELPPDGEWPEKFNFRQDGFQRSNIKEVIEKNYRGVLAYDLV
jgi:hypothetical protein